MSTFIELLRDIYDFLKTRKILVSTFNLYYSFMGALIIVTQGSVIAPFIYTLF